MTRRSWTRNVPVALPLGAGLAAWQYHRLHTKMREEGVTHDAAGVALDDGQGVAVGKAGAVGAGMSVALYLAATGEKLFAQGVGSGLTAMNPRTELMGRPVGHAVAFGLLGFAGFKGLQHVFQSAETTGDAVEAAYSAAPTSEYVSAGPRSAVPLETIAREGRRFVNMALTVEEIEAVMGGPAKPPIRVFVGLETKDTTSEWSSRHGHARVGGPRGVRAKAHRVHVTDRHRVPELRDRRVAGVPDPRGRRPGGDAVLAASLAAVAVPGRDRDRPEQRVPARPEVAAGRDPRRVTAPTPHLRGKPGRPNLRGRLRRGGHRRPAPGRHRAGPVPGHPRGHPVPAEVAVRPARPWTRAARSSRSTTTRSSWPCPRRSASARGTSS